MKCKKHNKNVFLSKRDYKRVRRLSLFKGPAFMIFLVTYLYFFIKGLKVLPVAIVGTLILATYFVICYSFYKKTCKNKKYYHISNDPEFLYYKFDYRKNSK